MRHNLLLGVAAAALIVPAAASAQETTAQISGTVTDANGAPVSGAVVSIVHTPSGSTSTVTSNSDGSFSASGLRVGGPFTVTVTQGGQTVATVSDVFTVIGQPYNLPIALQPQEADVVVKASSIRGSGTNSLGPQTLLRAEDISKVASINRDVRDIARRDPFATIDYGNNRAVSFAGVNPRYNSFTVNGVTVNDRFGLNSDANPTRRGPVPFDAIDQVTISLSPVDIRQGNFTGGAIDLVLRSGTNRYEGTGFWSRNSDGLSGNRNGASTSFVRFTSDTYGGRVSGPIIKDKLFIMVAAERTKQGLPATQGLAGEGFADPIPNLTRAQVQQVQQIAQQVYNYNTGDLITNLDEVDEKIVGRIDWNINDRHKLFLTYTNAFDSLVNPQGSSSNTSTPALGLRSNGYLLTELQRSGQVQLNSDWTDRFSTEIRFGYLSFKRGQDSLQGTNFAQFRVCLDPTSVTSTQVTTASATTCSTGVPTVVFGPDISRQANQFFSDDYQASVQARLKAGNHDIKLLAGFDEYRVYNLFVQNATGNVYFDSLADFQARRASSLTLQGAVNGDLNSAAANFKIRNWTFGIQDTWKVFPTFSVTAGVRYDLYDQNGQIALNNNVVNRLGVPNTYTLAGRGILQPRLGFDWRVTPRLSIRGTAAIFSGGSPAVYLSNSYANTGILTNTINILRNANGVGYGGGVSTTLGDAALTNVTGTTYQQAVIDFVRTAPASVATAQTNLLDPNFKIPSVFRATLNGNYKLNLGPLGDGWNIFASYLFSKQRNQITVTDSRSGIIGFLPDGRPRYSFIPTLVNGVQINGLGTTQTTDNNFDLELTNSSVGRSHIGVIGINKRWDFGLSAGGSYTLQDVRDAAPQTSSVALSNYQQAAFGDPNIQAAGTSNDQTTWQFKYNLGFDHAFFGDYRTIIQLFGETKAGRRYSFTMQDNTAGRSPVFGTIGSNTRYLLYVPTANDPRVSYDSAATQASLETLIANSALGKYRGQIAPKNIARSRANTRIDLHLEQEIPTFIGKSRISLYADIENLPNLLNSNWGGLRQQGFFYAADVVRVQCLSAPTATGTAPAAGVVNTAPTQTCAQYRYSAYREPNTGNIATPVSNSLYAIRLGARVTF